MTILYFMFPRSYQCLHYNEHWGGVLIKEKALSLWNASRESSKHHKTLLTFKSWHETSFKPDYSLASKWDFFLIKRIPPAKQELGRPASADCLAARGRAVCGVRRLPALGRHAQGQWPSQPRCAKNRNEALFNDRILISAPNPDVQLGPAYYSLYSSSNDVWLFLEISLFSKKRIYHGSQGFVSLCFSFVNIV